MKYKTKPFNTECYELQTKDECIEKCVIEKVIKNKSFYPFGYFTDDINSSLKFGGFRQLI